MKDFKNMKFKDLVKELQTNPLAHDDELATGGNIEKEILSRFASLQAEVEMVRDKLTKCQKIAWKIGMTSEDKCSELINELIG
jgi:hypothetical protein